MCRMKITLPWLDLIWAKKKHLFGFRGSIEKPQYMSSSINGWIGHKVGQIFTKATVSLLKSYNFWRSCFLSLQSPRFHRSLTYILKADPATQTAPQKNLNFPQICPKMPQNGPKMAKKDPKWRKVDQIWPKMALNDLRMTQNDPKITQNGSKWPQMAGFTHFFRNFFDWKSGSANFFAFRMYGSQLSNLYFRQADSASYHLIL